MASSSPPASPPTAALTLDSLTTSLSFWTNFNFPKQRLYLDEISLQIASQQERSAKARTALANETREFKKTSPTPDFNPLLKSYQREIDEVTKRARLAESALSELYKSLRDAPDPAAWLEETARLDAEAASLRFDNAKLSAEVAQFETEFGQLKNQDITIRQLQDGLAQLERDVERRVEQGVAAKLAEVAEAQEERELHQAHEWEELRGKLALAERDAAEQRQAAERARAELYELRLEERDAAHAAELEQLHEELASLRAAANTQAHADMTRLRRADDDSERRARDEELARAYLALDAARLEAARSREAEAEAARRRDREADETRAQLEARLAREHERCAALEAQLAAQVRRRSLTQLTCSRAGALFSAPRADSLQAIEPPAPPAAEPPPRELESALAASRLALADRDAEVASLRAQRLQLEERLADQASTIQQLQRSETALAALPSQPPGDVLHIVQEQRDRFRRRMLELEAELESQTVQSTRLSEALNRTRAELALCAERSKGRSMLPRGASAADASSLSLSVARLVLANPIARSMLAGYFFVLHLLVMATTHHASTSSANLRGVHHV